MRDFPGRDFFGFIATCLALILVVIWSIFIASLSTLGYLVYRPLGEITHRWWGAVILWLLGIRADYRHLERLPPAAVLASNHESMFDMMALAAMPYEKRWISKKSIAYLPFIGWAMKAMGCYFVTRDRSGRDVNVMKQVEDGLRAGHSVVIFPEGTRTRTGELLPFKKGAFRLAINAGVPLVPIAISGSRSIAPPGKLPTRRGHRMIVQIGEPMRHIPGEPVEDFMARYRTVLVGLLKENQAS